MVTITSSGNSVQFTFQDCPTYLNNGKIELPKSSLALVIDESNMATFKKAASNDIFVSVSLDELDMTKDELIAYYINNMVSTGGGGESGVTPEEVSQMIDTAIAPLEQDIDFLQDDVDDVSGNVETLSGEIDAKEEVISTAINELYDGIGEVSGDVGTLSGQVTANTSNISTVSGNVQTLSTTVSGIQTDLGGIKLVKLTRAQYEALAVKDTNTLYIIPDE